MIHGLAKRNASVPDMFRDMVAKYPDKVCLLCEESQMTFTEVRLLTCAGWCTCRLVYRLIRVGSWLQVDEYSNKVASVFLEHGYRKGDVVALFMDNRPEFVCLWLGLAKLGVVVPLINYNLRLNSLLHSVTVADSQALIYSSDLADGKMLVVWCFLQKSGVRKKSI